jgi:hypothetical protein
MPDIRMASLSRFVAAGFPITLARAAPLDLVGRFGDIIEGEADRIAFAALRADESTGRPVGSSDFVATLERVTGRHLRAQSRDASQARGWSGWSSESRE